MIELLRKLVRQQTVTVQQPVTNIHGASAGSVQGLSDTVTSTWLLLTTAGLDLPSLDEFYQRYLLGTQHDFQLLDAPLGRLTHTETSPVVQLFRGVVRFDVSSSFSLTVELQSAGSRCSLYVNGVLDRTGVGGLELARQLPAGEHLLELLVSSSDVAIQTPANIKVDGEADTPPQPVWSSATSGYLDTTTGATKVDLAWYADRRAGGWTVFRRPLVELSVIDSVGEVDPSGQYGIVLGGNWTGVLAEGAEVLATGDALGNAIRAWYDADSQTTSVRMQLPRGASRPEPTWVGRLAYTGTQTEIAHIRRTTTSGVVTHTDTAVEFGRVYYYTLQAYGVIDPTAVGPLSESRLVVAGDITAPDKILIIDKDVPTTGYPRVRNKVATVKFRTPEDDDYAGVRVYFRQKLTGTITSVAGAAIGVSTTLDPNANIGWRLRVTSGVANGLEQDVVSNSETGVVLGAAFPTGAEPAVGESVLLYTDQIMVTDFGVPAQDDELMFETVGYGEYQFRSFDLSGNEQEDDDSEIWDYDPSDDIDLRPNLPPTIQIEQLTPEEQASFSGYSDPEQYAILLLTARDADQDNPTLGINIRYRKKGTPTSVVLPAATDAVPGTVDDPLGTRSRYVAVARPDDETTIEVWAVDAEDVESDHLLYTIDYDNSPEVTSVEHAYDIGNEQVFVTITVDDDTRGLRIWMNPSPNLGASVNPDYSSAAPSHVDTTALKSVRLTVRLKDGTRKQLFVQPWSHFAGGVTQGSAGETVIRELVQTPRTTVTFESRDETGAVSSIRVRANIYVVPPIKKPSNRTSAASGSTVTTLVDSGSPGWVADSFAYSEANLVYYFVEVDPGQPGAEVRKVVANGGTMLEVDPPFTAPPHGKTYRIWPGATIWQVEGTSEAYIVDNKTFFDRKSDASTIVTYRSVISGSAPEALHRTSVDADTSAHIEKLIASEGSNQVVTLTVSSDDPVLKPPFDDDCKYWRLYARKGGTYPTLSSAAPTRGSTKRYDMDERYLRFQSTPANPSVSFSCGSGDWVFVAVPFNSANEDGDFREAKLTVSGTSPGLSSVQATASGSTATIVSWQTRNFGAGTYTVDVGAQKYDANGAAVGAPVSVATGASAAALTTTHSGVGTRVAAGQGVWYVWRYSLTLKESGVPVGTFSCELGDFFSGATGTLSGVAASNYRTGSTNTALPPYKCRTALVNRVEWSASGYDGTHFIEVELSEDNGLSYNLLASGLVPSAGTYDHYVDGVFSDASGYSRMWKYRVRLVNQATAATIDSAESANLTDTVADCVPAW